MGESRRQYDEEFKRNAVELCRTSGKTASQIARDLGINSSMLRRWQREQAKSGERAFPGMGRLMRGTELEEENRRNKSRKTYGSPRIHRKLGKEGIHCGKKRVERLMREAGIQAIQKRKFKMTTDSRHNLPVAENILNRDFTASSPNASRVSDITYINTEKGWLYLAAVMDLHSKRM